MKAITGEVRHQSGTLTAREQHELIAAETDVERGGKLIVAAMELIRDKRLYRASYETFEDYCRERWNKTRRAVDNAIQMEAVVQRIAEHLPDQNEKHVSHRAVAEVADLPPETAAAIVAEAAKDGGKPTAAKVRKARQASAPQEDTERKPSGGNTFDPSEWEGPDYSTEKKKASDAIGAAIRRVDDLNRVNRKNALHQKALDSLSIAFDEVGKW